MLKTAALFHFRNATYLHDFQEALTRLPADVDLYINIAQSQSSPGAAQEQEEMVRVAFPQANVVHSEDRGMAIGGLFRLLEHIRGKNYGAIMFAHGLGNDDWRKQMLLSLSLNSGKVMYKFMQAPTPGKPPAGMVGSRVSPFDYYNIGPFMGLAARQGIKLNTTWEAFYAAHPEAQNMPVLERASWAIQNNFQRHRPEVDLEYARASFASQNLNAESQPMTEAYLRQFATDGVIGQLPFYPKACFWMNGKLLQQMYRKIDFGAEFTKLPLGEFSDNIRQSPAHAWERLLPVIAARTGFGILSLE